MCPEVLRDGQGVANGASWNGTVGQVFCDTK